MIHCVLVANRQSVTEISLPHWEPVFGGEDGKLAALYFRRLVACNKHICVLWVTVSEEHMLAVRGFVDWTDGGDEHIDLELPRAIEFADHDIAAMAAYVASLE